MTVPSFPERRSRRQQRRSMCSDFVTVRAVDQAGRMLEIAGLLEDISPGGFCASLDTPLPPGRIVRVLSDGFDYDAEVRYCQLGDYSYLVGFEFVKGAAWDLRQWRPKHLFQPPY